MTEQELKFCEAHPGCQDCCVIAEVRRLKEENSTLVYGCERHAEQHAGDAKELAEVWQLADELAAALRAITEREERTAIAQIRAGEKACQQAGAALARHAEMKGKT